MSGSNQSPGWAFGVTPNALEWSDAFAVKIDEVGGKATGLNIQGVGFNGAPVVVTPPVVTDLKSLAVALAAYGLIVDNVP